MSDTEDMNIQRKHIFRIDICTIKHHNYFFMYLVYNVKRVCKGFTSRNTLIKSTMADRGC